ncbi:type I restriction endonuclease [Halococcoides cellulosivorans]|uniref:DNA helicase n=1 Tax=Halococcoides cellulosivorans TaxID=1679096 RepID=A0A2R4X3W7_9EURY|nr:type I restriction endonuclease [Halococcoides cellulosivorans]AWB28492.1 hypothetical protein HARCEL1_12670 [Halococcoides cellulosivorans]
MVRTEDRDVVDSFQVFFKEHCREGITELAENYRTEQTSLNIDYEELVEFDEDLAADVRSRPAQLQEYAKEALRQYGLPFELASNETYIRFRNLPERTAIPSIRADHRGRLVAVEGIVRDASDVRPKITTAAFECQRCGTLTRIPQRDGSLEEPHECQGCEQEGPFEINFDRSKFVDAQSATIHSLTPGDGRAELETRVEDDLAGTFAPGDPVRITAVVRLEERGDSPEFEIYLDGMSVSAADWDALEWSPASAEEQPADVEEALEEFQATAASVLGQLSDTVREEETKAKLVTPFVDALGWDPTDPRQVRLEYTDGEINDRPDYALFVPDRDHPVVVIEAKRLGRNLDMEHRTRNYMREYGADWGIFTNGETYRIFETAEDDDRPTEEFVAEIGLDDVHRSDVLLQLARSAYC